MPFWIDVPGLFRGKPVTATLCVGRIQRLFFGPHPPLRAENQSVHGWCPTAVPCVWQAFLRG